LAEWGGRAAEPSCGGNARGGWRVPRGSLSGAGWEARGAELNLPRAPGGPVGSPALALHPPVELVEEPADEGRSEHLGRGAVTRLGSRPRPWRRRPPRRSARRGRRRGGYRGRAPGTGSAHPLGGPAPSPPRGFLAALWGGLANLWGAAGCELDPSGRCISSHIGTAPAGHGRGTKGLVNLRGANGCEIDPDGRSVQGQGSGATCGATVTGGSIAPAIR
jgi:hypothetical protein